MKCLVCQLDGEDVSYMGESGRTGHECQTEHINNWRTQSDKSHFSEHFKDRHPEVQLPTYTKGRVPLDQRIMEKKRRQEVECVLIRLDWKKGKKLLKKADEYNRCLMPELATKEGLKLKLQAEEETNKKRETEEALKEFEEEQEEKESQKARLEEKKKELLKTMKKLRKEKPRKLS